MNLIIITGTLADNVEVVDGRRIEATVIEKRKGSGQYADKTFTKYVKVLMYGRDIEQIAKTLTVGKYVEVQGEADVEAYLSKRDNKPAARLKVVGKIALLELPETEERTAPAPRQRTQTQNPAPASAPLAPAAPPPEDDDVPF